MVRCGAKVKPTRSSRQPCVPHPWHEAAPSYTRLLQWTTRHRRRSRCRLPFAARNCSPSKARTRSRSRRRSSPATWARSPRGIGNGAPGSTRKAARARCSSCCASMPSACSPGNRSATPSPCATRCGATCSAARCASRPSTAGRCIASTPRRPMPAARWSPATAATGSRCPVSGRARPGSGPRWVTPTRRRSPNGGATTRRSPAPARRRTRR